MVEIRRGMPWLAGLVAVAVACAGVAVALELRSAALFHEVDVYSRSQTGVDPVSVEQSDYYNSLWLWSGGLHEVVSPLLAGAVLGLLGLVTALAIRWERRERRRA